MGVTISLDNQTFLGKSSDNADCSISLIWINNFIDVHLWQCESSNLKWNDVVMESVLLAWHQVHKTLDLSTDVEIITLFYHDLSIDW